jgi:ribosomal protein S3AE
MDQIDVAIHQTVHESDISAKEIAQQLGMSHQVLINKANPTSEFHKLSLREALAIMKITGSTSIHEAVGLELGLHSMRPDIAEPKSLMDAMLTVVSECGDVSRAVKDAMEDGRLTAREKAEMQREINEAIDSLMAMRLAIKAHR